MTMSPTPGATAPSPQSPGDFDPGSGSLVERMLFNHRWVVLLLCLLVTVGTAIQATQVKLQASFERMLPLQHPYIVNYLAHRADVSGQANTLRIAVETRQGSIFDPGYLDTLRRLNDEVFLLPGVDRAFMKSLWTPSTRWLAVTEEGIDGGPVIPDSYDGSPASIDQLRTNVERSGEVGQLVAADYQSSIILVPLLEIDTRTGQPLDYAALSQSLERLRAKYEQTGVVIHITGFGKVVGDLIEGLKQVLAFFAAAVVICALALYGYTRCMRSTALVVACSLVAVVWLLGLLPTLGYRLDPYSILVPFLVFAIGMSHGAQKMNGIMQDIGRGSDKLVAARLTFRRLFLAGLTALLADVVGFAVLLVIDIGVIQDMAVTASMGVGMLIFTNLVLLPILLSYVGVSGRAADRSLREERAEAADGVHARHPFWAFLDSFTARRGATLALVTAAVLGVVGFGVSTKLKIGDLDPGAPELRPDSRYNRDNAYMTSHYAASSDVLVVMVKTAAEHCVDYDTLITVDALEWELRQLPGVEGTNSFAGFTARALAGMSEGNLKWSEIQRNQNSINAVAARASQDLFNQACDLLSIYVYLKDHKADTLSTVVDRVEHFGAQYGRPELQFLLAAGNAGVDAATNIVVKHANVLMLALVYAAVTVLAFITFRSWRAVACAVIPLGLTSVLCEALMVGLGIGVKVATLPVIALGVGIGVDYALYVLSVTLAGLRAGARLSDAYYKALLFTGKVVVLTGVTLGIAVASWAFSPIKFQADMGILLAFMFVGNMLGALILLPALGHFLLAPRRPVVVPQAASQPI